MWVSKKMELEKEEIRPHSAQHLASKMVPFLPMPNDPSLFLSFAIWVDAKLLMQPYKKARECFIVATYNNTNQFKSADAKLCEAMQFLQSATWCPETILCSCTKSSKSADETVLVVVQ